MNCCEVIMLYCNAKVLGRDKVVNTADAILLHDFVDAHSGLIINDARSEERRVG